MSLKLSTHLIWSFKLHICYCTVTEKQRKVENLGKQPGLLTFYLLSHFSKLFSRLFIIKFFYYKLKFKKIRSLYKKSTSQELQKILSSFIKSNQNFTIFLISGLNGFSVKIPRKNAVFFSSKSRKNNIGILKTCFIHISTTLNPKKSKRII